MRAAVVAAALVLLAGCSRPSYDAASLTSLAAAHVDDFRDFDRWARRAADTELRDDAPFHETLFSPLARRQDVCGAWVERSSAQKKLVVARGRATRPESGAWVRLSVERLPKLRAVTAKLARDEGRGEPRWCIVLARSAETTDGATVDVAVAFTTAGAATSR